MSLTGKQKLFVHQYPIDFNATQAAIRAGYSQKTAYSIGFENLRKPEIKEAISKVLKEKIMSADEVLTRITHMAQGDIGPYLETTEDGTISVNIEQMKSDGKAHLLKKVKQRKRVVTTTNERTGVERTQTDWVAEIELHDAQAALHMMGKHHKLFVDRTEITDADGKPLIAMEAFEKALEKVYGTKGG